MVATPVITNVGLFWEWIYSWGGSILGADLFWEWIYSGSGSSSMTFRHPSLKRK